MYTFFEDKASGETAALGGTVTSARLALLDAWSDGNPPPHDRLLPLGEALAAGLAETRPLLVPFLSRF
jgi:hypothetical protein